MASLKPETVFEVPGSPDWIAVGDAVWISNKPKNSIARIDPKTNKVAETDRGGKAPCSGARYRLRQPVGSELQHDRGLCLEWILAKTNKVTVTVPIGDRRFRGRTRGWSGQHLDADG